MYLHIGNNKTVRTKEILGIFDTDNATLGSSVTKKFLLTKQKEKRVISAGDDIPKSFVVYGKRNDNTVCFSLLSPSALLGRLVGDGKNAALASVSDIVTTDDARTDEK